MLCIKSRYLLTCT